MAGKSEAYLSSLWARCQGEPIFDGANTLNALRAQHRLRDSGRRSVDNGGPEDRSRGLTSLPPPSSPLPHRFAVQLRLFPMLCLGRALVAEGKRTTIQKESTMHPVLRFALRTTAFPTFFFWRFHHTVCYCGRYTSITVFPHFGIPSRFPSTS